MLDAYRDLIDDLLDTPNVIRGAFAAESGGDGSPEAKRLIATLRDRDKAVLARVQTVTRQHSPYLPALRLEEPSADEAMLALLEAMDTARGELVSLLINMSLKDWDRPAIHETDGEITLADEVERHVEFDEDVRRRLQQLQS